MAQFRSRLCKPTAAMCLLGLLFLLGPSDFPLSRPVFSPCHTFCHSFATCVASAFARNASWPFRCHVCCQGLLPAAEISPLNLPPVLFPHPRICQCVFLPPMLPLPLPPSAQIATAIAFALEIAIVVAIKFGCRKGHCF